MNRTPTGRLPKPYNPEPHNLPRSTKWEVREVEEDEAYPYLLILLWNDGNHISCGHERFRTKEEGLARAQVLAAGGQRCDLVVDVAASYGIDS